MSDVMPYVGYQAISVDSVIGVSGKPVVLFGYTFQSGATPGIITFKNGTTGGATSIYSHSGVASAYFSEFFPNGIVFPSGLYAVVDLNMSLGSVVIFYRQLVT